MKITYSTKNNPNKISILTGIWQLRKRSLDKIQPFQSTFSQKKLLRKTLQKMFRKLRKKIVRSLITLSAVEKRKKRKKSLKSLSICLKVGRNFQSNKSQDQTTWSKKRGKDLKRRRRARKWSTETEEVIHQIFLPYHRTQHDHTR